MTLNQILNHIQRFQQSHRQLKAFFNDLLSEYATGKGGLYPVLTCTVLPSPFSEGKEVFTFEFGVFDKMNLDWSNEIEVLSDTRLICLDLLAFIKNNPDFKKLSLELPVTLEPHTEQFDDAVTGHFMTVNLYQPTFLDFCGLPISQDEVAYSTEDGEDFITEDGKTLILS